MGSQSIDVLAPPEDPLLKDALYGNLPYTDGPETKKLCFIGYPCDEGLTRNKFRPGAAKGPAVFREYISRRLHPLVNHEFDVDMRSMIIKDFGDCEGKDLEGMQASLLSMAKKALSQGFLTVSIGGCRDESYPHAKALMEHEQDRMVNVITVDAHMAAAKLIDGKQIHSCSPFYLLLQDAAFKGKLVQFASQNAAANNTAGTLNFVKENGGRIMWLSGLRAAKGGPVAKFRQLLGELSASGDESIYVSFDLDAMRSSDCPGVTLPSAVGLTNEEAVEIFREAGHCPAVKAIDISEFNPTVEEVRTGKLVAHLFYYFVIGYAERGAEKLK